jgi:hypothetical protein
MQELLKRKEELEIKLDHYSRTDREAFNRVLMGLFEVEMKIKNTLTE